MTVKTPWDEEIEALKKPLGPNMALDNRELKAYGYRLGYAAAKTEGAELKGISEELLAYAQEWLSIRDKLKVVPDMMEDEVILMKIILKAQAALKKGE